jgi:hypothetical protein
MKRTALAPIIVALFISVLLLSTMVGTQLANAESPSQWNKVLMNGDGESVVQTSDGGFAIAGQSGGKTLLVKTNSAGEVEWSKTYGDGSPYRALSVIQTSDGGYALGCISRSNFNFLKTDSAGNMEWYKGFFYGSNDVIEFDTVVQTRDGGYFLAGGCIPGNSGFIVKTDENGNMQWNRTFAEHSDTYFLPCAAEAIDDGYLLGGKYLIKVDSLGNVQWNRSIFVSSIVKTSDGKYVLLGSGQLTKIDLQGNTEWSRSYDSFYKNYYTINSGGLARDGGYIFVGTASSSAPMAEDYSGYVAKVDAGGKVAWTYGYSGTNLINSIVTTADGFYVFTGVNPYYLSGGNDGVWLVKIGENPASSTEPSPQTPTPQTEPRDSTPPSFIVLLPENSTYTTAEIALNFTVNEEPSQITYSLDGQENVTIAGNTTLTGLSVGEHNVTVYAWDAVGNVGSSQTIDFVVAQETEPEPFPTLLLVAVSVVVAAVVAMGVLVYWKKRKR